MRTKSWENRLQDHGAGSQNSEPAIPRIARQKILIVDDKEANLVALAKVLEDVDATVIKAQSGDEALKVTLNHDISLLVLDIQMPGMNGYELATHLRRDKKTMFIPIIFVTAIYNDEEHMFEGYEAGGVDYIIKPYSPVVMVSKVHVFLEMDRYKRELKLHRDHLERLVEQRNADLVEREAMLSSIYASAPVIMAVIDKHGRFRNINSLGAAFTRRTMQDIVGVHVCEALPCARHPDHPDGRGRGAACQTCTVHPGILHTLKTGESLNNLETTLWVNRDRGAEKVEFLMSTVAVEIGGERSSLAILIDVTSRNRAEAALRENEARYRKIAAAVTDYIYTVRVEGDRVAGTTHSEASIAVTGYTPEEFHANPFLWLNMVCEQDRDLVSEQAASILSGGTPDPIEHRIIRKDGAERWVSSALVPHRDENGNLDSYDGLLHDITERKQAELEMISALTKAAESERLKSSFLATMSHELRTPLNAIIGFSDIIDEELPIDEVMEFNKMINISGKHLLNIVEDLFDIALIESRETRVHIHEIKLHALMRDVHGIMLAEQQIMSKEDLTLNAALPPEYADLSIKTDPSKLKQILINLIKNALKFTHEGCVDYGYRYVEDHGRPELLFYVQDTGIGIPEDKQELIFNIFRQVEDSETRTYDGTGIGLSIAQKLTELLGGRIWLESELGAGSIFYFTIPIEGIDRAAIQTDPSSLRKKSTSEKSSILIVEDNVPSYSVLKFMLEKIGDHTLWAKNGREAVEICQENRGIDLVLMDINMPVMDGYAATREIKTFSPDLPIIAQTSFALLGDRDMALQAGCDDYIAKPLKMDELYGLLDKYRKPHRCFDSV